jgi:hypothetical protein
MNDVIRSIENSIGVARRGLRKIRRVLIGDHADDRRVMIRRYHVFTSQLPDLDHPRGFLEKLLWLNLYHRDPRIPSLVDKWLARERVARLVGADVLNEIIGVWDRPEEIPFDALPNQFVIKASAGSGWNIICRDKAKLDIADAMKRLKIWQRQNYYHRYREWQYRSLQSRFIAERFVCDDQHPDRCAADIKLFCFNGIPRIVGVCTDRFGDPRHDFFDCDWKPVDYGLTTRPRSNPPLGRPDDLARLIDIAARLSHDFPFVRVDLYRFKGKILFGELTFSPSAGNMPIQRPEADAIWGQWLTLPAARLPHDRARD